MMVAVALALTFTVSCQKQQPTENERRAEVERQVQDRLAAEHQKQQADDLSKREAEVASREQALREQQNQNTTVAQETRTDEPETSSRPVERPRPQASGSYSTFYTKLEPYGDWLETDDYGYVYRPREATANRSWRPYTDGRWVYSDAGWTWVSEEPFGWATYHYGRWTRLQNVGWVWVPGDEWAPAWVSWRKGGEYVGWAPLPPEARFERRTGIHNWSDNYYDVGPDQYVFVATRQFGEERVERAIVPEQQNVTIVQQTSNVTNITYNNTVVVNQGPSYDELQRQSATPIARLRLERETFVTGENPRAMVRGDVVAIPAPVIAAQPQERPRAVKEKIAQTAVDLGWSNVNQREADQARAKMKAEATLPPNAPPKKAARVSGIVPAAPVAAGPVATPNATVASTPSPALSAQATPVNAPAANGTPLVPARTPLGLAHPAMTPPSAPPATSIAPSGTGQSATPFQTRREQKKEAKELRREQRFNRLGAPTTPETAASVPPQTNLPPPAAATPFLSRKEEKRELRREQRLGVPSPVSSPSMPAGAAPATTATAAPTAAVTPFLSKRELKQERKAERRAARTGQTPEETPSPSATTSPGG